MFERRDSVAAFSDFARLGFPGSENYARTRIVHDVNEAIERFIKINWDACCAQTLYREVGDVPFGAVRRENRDTVAGFNSQLAKGFRQSCHPT